MTRIILTRHGRTEWNTRKKIMGHKSIPLDETGVRQAQELGETLAKEKVHAIYSSPLSRAEDTAKEIARHHDLAPVIIPDVAERDYGEHTGVEVNDLTDEELEKIFHFKIKPKDGESVLEVADRAISFLKMILDQHKEETVVIVGHGTFNRLLLSHLFNWPLKDHRKVKQENCAITEIIIEDGKPRLVRLNDTSHLT